MAKNATRSPYLREASKTYAPTPEDIEALLAVAGSERSMSGIRGRALILTLWASGARVSEVLSMLRMDLEGLGDPSCLDPRIRLWRSKKAPKGRPRGGKKALAAWEAERRAAMEAEIQELEDLKAAGDQQAAENLALIKLSAIQRGREPWDMKDRGGPESGIRLRGAGAQAAAAALRRWLRHRNKMPGGRTRTAPLWVTTRAANNPLAGGEKTTAGSLLRPTTFRTWLARRGELCGLGDKIRRIEGPGKRLKPHHLRHAFAAALWRETRDLQTVRAALGHSSSVTSEVYLRGLEVFDEPQAKPQETEPDFERAVAKAKLSPEQRARLIEALTNGGA